MDSTGEDPIYLAATDNLHGIQPAPTTGLTRFAVPVANLISTTTSEVSRSRFQRETFTPTSTRSR